MSAIVSLAAFAIVAADQAPLKAAPNASAATHARLAQGDLLEVRGTRLDHLQVYDHRRERAGYVKATQVRTLALTAAEAPQLLSVVRFLRDAQGMESLGIAYVAAYLKAAPAGAIEPEAFDALGLMAERLGERASRPGVAGNVTAQVEAVAAYGVKFIGYEHSGTVQLCYEGEAFRRVLTMAGASVEQRARAALALTRHDCVDPALRPTDRQLLHRRHAELLDSLQPAGFAHLDDGLKNRLRMRRASLWATGAYLQAFKDEDPQVAVRRALAELAGVNKAELSDDDAAVYTEAAIRVGAVRAGAEALPQPGRLIVRVRAGEPGQRCVQLIDAVAAKLPVLAERCTYGVVWSQSARASTDGRALALQVQQTATWTELWVWRRGADGWAVDVLPPASLQPEIGYAEFAGWSPAEGGKLLVAREAKAEGRTVRRFEVMSLASLGVEKFASTPDLLAAFGRWADPQWRRGSVSLR
jgi:hypothetical protein